MTTPHEAVAALPIGAAKDPELQRALLVGRYAYCLQDDEVATDEDLDLIALDPDVGSLIPALIYQGRIFALDEADSTTEHDGESCLVSSDGYRYKLDDLRSPTSVLDKDLLTPPGSPTVGNAYLIMGAPSGAWADFTAGDVAVFTARGWIALDLPIGKLMYVVDEEGVYTRQSTGVWTAGIGVNALPDESIKVSQFIGGGDLVHFIVENQSTNTPPASPVKGDTYVIGNSPTGSWALHAGKIARCEVTGSFNIYTPREGWRVYDKALDADYRFTGTAWASQRGALIFMTYVERNVSESLAFINGTGYTFHETSAPTSSHTRFDEVSQLEIAHAARRTGAVIEVEYDCDHTAQFVSVAGAICLFEGAGSSALDWRRTTTGQAKMLCIAPDTAERYYKIKVMRLSGAAASLAMLRRRLTLREYA